MKYDINKDLQGQQQQSSKPSKPKPKPKVSNEDFKKVFEAEVKKRYGDKVASKVIFI